MYRRSATVFPVASIFPRLKETKGSRRLLRGASLPVCDPADLPRRIYLYWQQGLQNAPDLVQHCVASWKALNPDWEVVVLDHDMALDALPDTRLPNDLTPAAYADLLRVTLLARHGGVWADATVLCLRPLDDWLPLVFNQADFFAFQRPSDDRMVASWFLASTKGAHLSEAWRQAAADYLEADPKDRPYFWFHYLFEYLIRTNRQARQNFRQVPVFSADPPHILQRHMHDPDGSGVDPARILTTPMQKLTYKQRHTADDVQRVLDRLRPGEL